MKENLIRTLQDLVAIKSDLFSDFTTIVDYVVKHLSFLGMTVELVGPAHTPVILASYGEGGLLFSGHLDTVPIGVGWSVKQGEIRNGRVYGRGTADMKSGCAAILECADELVQNDIPFSICFTTDEEEQMCGAHAIVSSSLIKNSAGVIICEPTSMHLTHSEKGLYTANIITRGSAAHASQPWLGRDAILKMHYCIDRLVDLVETSAQKKTGTTMCITTIHGGDKNNVVTDSCTVEIDMRFEKPTVHQDVHDMLINRLRGESYELIVSSAIDAFESDLDSAIGKELVSYLKKPVVDMPYVTEAPFFAKSNENVFVCGPGNPQVAHAIDEYVEISEMEHAYDMLIHMAKFVNSIDKN